MPKGNFLGIGLLWFVGDDDGSLGSIRDEWPLEIHPVFVEVDDDLYDSWHSHEWEDGTIGWTANGFGKVVGAQFSHA